MKIYVEYGLDFDNNRFGLGRSVEIESEDGTEKRKIDLVGFSKLNHLCSRKKQPIHNKLYEYEKVCMGIRFSVDTHAPMRMQQ